MDTPTKPIRVVLADDHTLVRAGIRALLERLPGVTVAGEAEDGREVLDLVAAHKPDLVLMDIGMPGLNGLEATARIVREYPDTRVIILSMHHNEEYVWRALRTGAAGYLIKKAATAELAAALKRVVEGEVYLSREISSRLLKNLPAQGLASPSGPLERLTERQREVLQLIAEGRTTKEIALMLKVSPKTVEYHRMQIMQRVDVHDVPGLVRLALRVGLVSEEH